MSDACCEGNGTFTGLVPGDGSDPSVADMASMGSAEEREDARCRLSDWPMTGDGLAAEVTGGGTFVDEVVVERARVRAGEAGLRETVTGEVEEVAAAGVGSGVLLAASRCCDTRVLADGNLPWCWMWWWPWPGSSLD